MQKDDFYDIISIFTSQHDLLSMSTFEDLIKSRKTYTYFRLRLMRKNALNDK